MSWIETITVPDGIEEQNAGRIVSYFNGDVLIQLAGFFRLQELEDIAKHMRTHGDTRQALD